MQSNHGDNGQFRVAIVGAGMGGLCAIQKLTENGIACTAFEKTDEVGGTWRDNVYPGLYVDIPISLYQLKFAEKYDWSRAFAPGSEIQQYLLDSTDRHGLRQRIRFGTEISEIRWSNGRWSLRTTDGSVHTADAVIAATGFLHVPTQPKIKNAESFEGVSFHSSQWPQGLDVEGKRVAVIGSGSSGIQIVSALAETTCRVDQYVRTPQWIETIKNPESNALTRWLGRRNSRLGKYLTEKLVDRMAQDPRLRDPRWKLYPGTMRNEAVQAFHDQMEVVSDPQLRTSLTPDFAPGCKRIPKSPHYFQAVQKPNVRIIRRGVDELAPTGVMGPDGEIEPYDIIVFATGFDAHAYMRPAKVIGADGRELDDIWGEAPFSYRGVSVPGFPNFYLLNGPFSPVNNVTVPKTLDDEMNYICKLIQLSAESGTALAPKQIATTKFIDTIVEELPRTVWWEGCDSWYRVAGKVPVLWPWLDKEHEAMFADVAIDDLEVFSRSNSSSLDASRDQYAVETSDAAESGV